MSSGIGRFKFSERMRPVADELYRIIVPDIIDIKRFDKDEERHILDREYAIDIQFTLSNGMIIIGQEKFREYDIRREKRGLEQFSDVTVELYNDPIAHIQGDWFNLCSQFYFVGFASRDYASFDRWAFLDWLQVALETLKGNIHWKTLKNTDGRAKANFQYTPFDSLPDNCIVERNR